MIFQPISQKRFQPYLVYAQRFDTVESPIQPNKYSGLFKLKRADGDSGRLGAVVNAERIRCAVDVTPFFSTKVHNRLNFLNAMEVSNRFNLNKYSDKETFQLLHNYRD